MPNQKQRTIVVTGAARGLGVRTIAKVISYEPLTLRQLEWVKQLSQDSRNFVIAVVRDPDIAHTLKPLLGPKTVAVKSDISDLDSLSVSPCQRSRDCDANVIRASLR